MLLWSFCISCAILLYTYAGYPLFVWLLARIRPRPINRTDITPSLTIIVACHNEAANIGTRLRNLLDADYPRERLQIVVVSDGSSDQTVDVAQSVSSDRITLLSYTQRRGKAAALNLAAEYASGEILVFADARQRFAHDALRELVSNFADQRVGAASGELMLDESSIGGLGLYWKYEKLIRRSEGRIGSAIGTTGAIYAIRRELWKPIPERTILDDVYTPMRIAMSRYRVVFDERARAYDTVASTSREFSRKVRTLTGNYQLCQLMPRLLVPTQPLVLQFYSHKLLRLLAPLLMMVMAVSSTYLASTAYLASTLSSEWAMAFRMFVALELLFVLSIPIGALPAIRNRYLRLPRIIFVFSMMNAAAVVGFVFFALRRWDVWESARR